MLPAAPGFARKVKPLVRLGERETAAYCVLRRIDYQVEECPMAAGNRHLGFKEMLNSLEERSPGTKAAFLFGFLERGHERFAADAEVERDELRAVHGVRRAHARRRLRVLPTPREGDRRPREAGEVGEWRARSPPATACSSSTPSAAVTSSPCRPGGQFHTHAGVLEHDSLIGTPEGSTVRTTLGSRLVAVRPTLAEYVLEMPRGAQVIYPKDLGPILILADVFPGSEGPRVGSRFRSAHPRPAPRGRAERPGHGLRDP